MVLNTTRETEGEKERGSTSCAALYNEKQPHHSDNYPSVYVACPDTTRGYFPETFPSIGYLSVPLPYTHKYSVYVCRSFPVTFTHVYVYVVTSCSMRDFCYASKEEIQERQVETRMEKAGTIKKKNYLICPGNRATVLYQSRSVRCY